MAQRVRRWSQWVPRSAPASVGVASKQRRKLVRAKVQRVAPSLALNEPLLGAGEHRLPRARELRRVDERLVHVRARRREAVRPSVVDREEGHQVLSERQPQRRPGERADTEHVVE